MQKIIECVPNISEGRDKNIIDEVASAAAGVAGVTVLDVDPGADTNRTVITFAGEPQPVLEAAFRLIKTAITKIDMSSHSGAHPRMGAVDVCPLVPVSGTDIEECAELAGELAARVGKELNLPVFLYGAAATRPERRQLPDIRAGEYEALEQKLKTEAFIPDAGPAVFNPKTGVTAIGARDFLLAYNINLNTKDVSLARDIALSVRERGRAKRDRNGEIIRNPDGSAVKVPGLLNCCQAAGWYIDEYGYAQVTMNLTNYHETGLHHGFDTVEAEARKRGLRVTGSEVIGLLPKKAVLDAGSHYLEKAGLNTGIPEREVIHTAVRSLGLNDTSPFRAAEKIVEFAADTECAPLAAMSCRDFIDELSSSSMAPGGGSVSAVSAALSAGLTSMAANIAFGKKDLKRSRSLMTETSIKAQKLKERAVRLIDDDTLAFKNFISAMRMPGKSEKEQMLRDAAIETAARQMTEKPLETLRIAAEIAGLAEKMLRRGAPSTASDSAAALTQAEAAAIGAYLNVKINLPNIQDQLYVKEISDEAENLLKAARAICKKGLSYAERRVKNES